MREREEEEERKLMVPSNIQSMEREVEEEGREEVFIHLLSRK